MQQETANDADLQEPGEAAGGAEGVEEPAGADAEASAGASEDTGESEDAVEELDELGQLTAELTKWRETALRVTADLDNYRKRMAREKTDLIRYGNQSLLEELLPVLDNFEMGLQAAAQDQGSMIYQGMQMVKKQLDDFLAAQGIEEVPAEGQAFDPNVHEAVSQQEADGVESGTVLRVTRRGYRMKERLLRPANVVVAKVPEDTEGDNE